MYEKYKDLEEYPDILNLKDVAKYLSISKDTVRKLCLNNQLKHIRVGRLYKITKENLVKFLEDNI